MINSVYGKVLKGAVKSAAAIALGTISEVLDMGAELADEGKDWVESLDKKDTKAREERKEKRKKDNQ